jgi:ABC-type taurine transport system ATPase subunit
LVEVAIKALRVVDLDREVYQLGLRGRIDPKKRPDLAEGMLKARAALREKLKDPSFASLVETYDVAKFNSNATLAENLMFGSPVDNRFDMEHFAEHPYILGVLAKVGLDGMMLALGHQVAETMVELFADLPPDHEFFQQFAFISSEDLPEFKAILARANKDQLGQLPETDRNRLLSLPFKTVPARHRLGIMSPEVEAKILEARRVFAADLPDDLKDAIDFFDADLYNPAHNLMDNILLGRVAYGIAQAGERVGDLVGELIEQLGLFKRVVEVGLSFEVGIAGGRLTTSQRQRLAIARAIIKNPDLLILSEATATLDSRTQAVLLERLSDAFAERGLIWGLHRASHARYFDLAIVMQDGRIVDTGKPDEIEKTSKPFKDLIAAE